MSRPKKRGARRAPKLTPAQTPRLASVRRESAHAAIPTPRFVAAARRSDASSPIAGIVAKPASRQPATAPNVFTAYKSPTLRPTRSSRRENARHRTGIVPPIAAVAGSSKRKTPANRANANPAPAPPGSGSSAKITRSRIAAPHGKASAATAIVPSRIAYSKRGRAVRAARAPRSQAPSAIPPKNAPRTEATASAVLPNVWTRSRVHTTSWTSAAAPERNTSSTRSASIGASYAGSRGSWGLCYRRASLALPPAEVPLCSSRFVRMRGPPTRCASSISWSAISPRSSATRPHRDGSRSIPRSTTSCSGACLITRCSPKSCPRRRRAHRPSVSSVGCAHFFVPTMCSSRSGREIACSRSPRPGW